MTHKVHWRKRKAVEVLGFPKTFSEFKEFCGKAARRYPKQRKYISDVLNTVLSCGIEEVEKDEVELGYSDIIHAITGMSPEEIFARSDND